MDPAIKSQDDDSEDEREDAMKKSIMIVIAALIVAGIAVSFFLFGDSVEKQTSALVSDAANSIAYAWNPEELKSRAEPGLIKAMGSHGQSVEQLFEIYSQLGKPKARLACNFKDSTTFSHYTTVTYVCDAEYESGPASMTLTLRKTDADDADWKIYYIKVTAAQFEALRN